MLQLKDINKQYITGDLTQSALHNVSLNLRDNEFVAILGPSGSGKTTLLNIIGGLDRYDNGDLVVDGVSTKQYKDRDWDSYRNHTIGFVFQSYNLIPHQSVLANVELALTISGVSRKERKKRAKAALVQVGLGDHINKKPNQLSGGQMQRVAIARALINNPTVLLADEPTGALDSETSMQVMELLKEVAKDRLVIMVTHNQELAEAYATRIVKLRDGQIMDDTNPLVMHGNAQCEPEHKNMGKAAMSFWTSLSLSFNNLRTKKWRTLLTAFAGSIGIIGIALILALSGGVNDYINDIQKETMTSYPITIDAEAVDMGGMMNGMSGMGRSTAENELGHALDGVYANASELEASTSMVSITENNLTEFKEYLDNPDSEIRQYLGESGIIYSYDMTFDVYAYDPEGILVNTDGSTLTTDQATSGALPMGGDGMPAMMGGGMSSMMSVGSTSSSDAFSELLPGAGDDLVSAVVVDSYDLLYGSWPQRYDEVVLVVDADNEITLSTLFALGLLPSSEYAATVGAIEDDDAYQASNINWSYEEIASQTFYLITASDYYMQNNDGTFSHTNDNALAMNDLLDGSLELTISGIIKPIEGAANATVSGTIGYTAALTNHLIDHTLESPVVTMQLNRPDVNVLNNMSFAPDNDAEKTADAKAYYDSLGISGKAELFSGLMSVAFMGQPEGMQTAQSMDEIQMAAAADEYFASADDDIWLLIYSNYVSAGSYEENMEAFGYVSLDAPSSISIYVDSFEDKDAIAVCIENYNATVGADNQITYTDYVALMTSSLTMIVDIITYVLIAFVAVSLVVSSIMIGIITYISVLERTKEIGILRAIGASKRNISQVFNAETFIIGLCSGLIGVGVTYLLLIPGNALIHLLLGTATVNAALSPASAAILIVISVVLTLIGGYIPSKKAAKKDPVTALRSE